MEETFEFVVSAAGLFELLLFAGPLFLYVGADFCQEFSLVDDVELFLFYL
jgi:hypothetical protein